MKEQIKKFGEDIYNDYIDFCQRIIKTPSLSGEEKEVADIYYDEMVKLGYDKVFKDDWGNVVGIIEGIEKKPVIMYNGHFDVVTEGDKNLWDQDPYGADIIEALVDNRYMDKKEMAEVICGRGSADMKCGGASQVYSGAILLKLREQGVSFKGTYLVAQVGLEEYGEMLGTLKLLEHLDKMGINLDAMVCAEPSSLRIMLGHRGRMELKVTVLGESCHGSSPWLGVNAVNKAAKLILEIEKAIWSNGYEDPDLGKSGIALTMMDVEPCELCIVPNKCTMVYDRRLVPGETVEGAVKEIQDIIHKLSEEDPEFKATVEVNENLRSAYTGKKEVIKSQKDPWKIEKEHPFVKACSNGFTTMGTDVVYGYWPFSTDIPAVSSILKKPVVGFSGAQEFSIHTCFEKTRTDYLKESLGLNVAMFLEAVKLPLDEFKA